MVLVSKDTSLVSIEAHDDGASDEEAGRWRAARRARGARARARARNGEKGKEKGGEEKTQVPLPLPSRAITLTSADIIVMSRPQAAT